MLQAIKARHKLFICSVAALVLLAVTGLAFIHFSFRGHLEGLYLLKGQSSNSFLIADDVYLGEEEVLVAGLSFTRLHNLLRAHSNYGRPHLEVDWDEADGIGSVSNYLGGDKVLMTNFSRYIDSGKQLTHGLFVGGALPEALLDADENNSGMSYFDGQHWSHIWCNTNEGIGSTVSSHRYPPSSWRFLGSRIVSQSADHIVLSSAHEIDVDGVLLRMERTVEMTAGEPDLNLTVKISNSGNGVGRYFYYYGDEPWLGDFGSASGDVGWVDGRLVEDEETIDPKTVAYAGMADYGSSALGEGHNFGHAANFIEWLGPDKPDTVFFANRYDGFNHDPRARVLLQGDGRSIGMYWGPRTLTSGQTQVFELAIGMAEQNPANGMPRIPASVSAAQAALARAATPTRKS
jgi:hypothetical protein